ncbi:hypothetical protein SRS16CHR_05235 [Variovorax sp. SRS16]|uniref:hypothetical protein n=1 Tax=Variovorax sp. SRS16 TaxID=282217 RepID=UPI001317E7FC|nr:hypothetical protein SRS16CHR_05235 [Variovorax sp. SRS16]
MCSSAPLQDPKLLRRLLRAKDRMDAFSHEPRPIHRLAQVKETPGAVRESRRAAANALDLVPACFLSAAHRPDLRTAVLEKRRRKAADINVSEEKEIPCAVDAGFRDPSGNGWKMIEPRR